MTDKTLIRKAYAAILTTLRDNPQLLLASADGTDWHAPEPEELDLLAHAKPSDVEYADDMDDYDLFDTAFWRVDVDCGHPMPRASLYLIGGLQFALDEHSVWDAILAGDRKSGKE